MITILTKFLFWVL